MNLRGVSMRALAVCLSLVLLLGVLPPASAEEPYDGGGKQGFLQRVDQYDDVPEGYIGIYTVADLKALDNANTSGDYILMRDLDLGAWTPICKDWPFKANFDGNGHTLTYTISCQVGKKTQWNLGVFAVVTGSVANLHVKGSMDVTFDPVCQSTFYAGGIAGILRDGGSVTNCVNDVALRSRAEMGSALKNEGVGGIVGYMSGASSVYFCRNRAAVNGYCGVGGIVGMTRYSYGKTDTIFACLNEGEVRCGIKAGGIIGRVFDDGSGLMVQSCANTAPVTAKEGAGGILGEGRESITVADSLNTGAVASTSAPSYAGGIAGDGRGVRYVRCVNTGAVSAAREGAIAGRIGTTDDVSYCYWLDTAAQEYCETADSGYNSNDRTGARSAASLMIQDDYETYDFEKLWVMDAALGCAYPLPLVRMDYDNTYKLSTEARKNERFEQCLALQSFLDSAGGPNGGAASVLHSTYRKAHLHIVNNGWKFIGALNKATSLDFSEENSFELVMTDLLYQSYGLEVYEELAAEKILSSCSDFFTGMEAFVTYSEAREIQSIMSEMARSGDVYARSTGELVNKLLGKLDGNTAAKFAGSGVSVVGTAYNVVSPVVSSVDDLREELNKYVLYNSHADISLSYAGLLQDMSACIPSTSAGSAESQWARSALGSLSSQLSDAARGDPSSLYGKAGGELLNFFSTEGKGVIDAFYGDVIKEIPVLAGAELGLKLGVPLANQITGMDSVAYYGGMMDCAGILSEALYQVVIDRMAAFRSRGDYETMAELKEAMELYFALQMLACDYGIGYNNAIIAKSFFGFLTKDEKKSSAQLAAYKLSLEKTRDKIRGTLPEGNRLTGYVVSCPVTVHVTEKDGTPVAVQRTGSQDVAEAAAGRFMLLGEEMDAKAGFYDEGTQVMWIEGEGEGAMSIEIFHVIDGENAGYEIYLDLPVTAGCRYTFENGEAVLNGTETFAPDERRFNPFEDVTDDAFYYEPVLWAVENGVTSGTDSTHFSPDANCTRGQVVTFLWRTAGSPAAAGTENPFTDVAEGAFYYEPVLWAVENGITSGTDATHFSPGANCTRGQIVTFLWRFRGTPEPGSAATPFTDLKTGAFYEKAVAWAVENGVTSGTDAAHFSPDALCKRGQVVTFLYRCMAAD